MNGLMKTEDREIKSDGRGTVSDRVIRYRKLIADEQYIDYAITQIAADLSHYLTR